MGLSLSRREASPTPYRPRGRLNSNGTVNRLPKRIILVRHGESLGNFDEEAYSHTPDWKIPLTEKGIEQSRALGVTLKERIGDSPVFVYCSPYMRTKQTLKYIMESFTDSPIVGAREEPRITEQQFGNFQKGEKMRDFKNERSDFGRFYYRFPEGEAGLDVFNRATGFIATLFRDWGKMDPEIADKMTVIVVTHGLTLRLFMMRWFHYTVHEFENSINPPNASFVCLNRVTVEDEWYPTQFKISQEGLALCNFPEKQFDPDLGRQHLDAIIDLEESLKV
mmetsp:Transcript_7408/g.11011  ORF Transcript_7408/g.11011 Transcript_7408/m.11011 type:complete len:279 (+) Transcript_7408:105-941(+)